ncbi:MAG: RNA-directed DNA polymerase [Bacteroidota bacterium]
MKTFGDLFPAIAGFENLVLAAKQAAKNKKWTEEMAAFHMRLEENLLQLQIRLLNKTYQPGQYRTFMVYDPKPRMISAAPYRDRVVHHALCHVIEPIFERTFIYDSYANRIGKGTHKAILRYQRYARRFPYVLKCDIRKFFPSIDHELLRQALRWKICCPDTLWLIDVIIEGSNEQGAPPEWFPGDDLFSPFLRRRGLPIGNLTSQFWGNVYLNRFDHFIKEKLGVSGYLRYVDDFVLFGTDKAQLWAWKQDCTRYLENVRLRIHPDKTQVYRVADGVPFLGFTIYPNGRRVQKAKLKRHRRHLRRMLAERKVHQLKPQQLEDSLNAWLGHIRFGKSHQLEQKTFRCLRSQGVNLHRHPRGSWRVLEQQ